MRLVVADDHRLLLEALSTSLAANGCTIEAAVSSASDALQAVGRHDPDVLLIDVTFPDGSGIETARRVRTAHPRTKVVLITGSTDLGPFQEAIAIGVDGYMRKARRVEQVTAVLESVMAGQKSYDRDLLVQLKHVGDRVPRQRPTPLQELTPREHRVLELLVEGLSTKEIVHSMGVSQSTVRTHVQNIFAKLGVHSRLEAVTMLDRGAPPGRASSETHDARRG